MDRTLLDSNSGPFFQTYIADYLANPDESRMEYINVGGCLYFAFKKEPRRLIYIGEIVEWRTEYKTNTPVHQPCRYYCKVDFRHNPTLVAIRNSARISDPTIFPGLGRYEDEYRFVKTNRPTIMSGRNMYLSQYGSRVDA